MKKKSYLEKKIEEYWQSERRWNIFFMVMSVIGGLWLLTGILLMILMAFKLGA